MSSASHQLRTRYLHTAVDDHSRLAYSEIHADEKKETATAFWTRAQGFITNCGITVERVLTDAEDRRGVHRAEIAGVGVEVYETCRRHQRNQRRPVPCL